MGKLYPEYVMAIKDVLVTHISEDGEYTVNDYVNRVVKFTVDMLLNHMFAWESSTCWGLSVKRRTPKHTIDYFW